MTFKQWVPGCSDDCDCLVCQLFDGEIRLDVWENIGSADAYYGFDEDGLEIPLTLMPSGSKIERTNRQVPDQNGFRFAVNNVYLLDVSQTDPIDDPIAIRLSTTNDSGDSFYADFSIVIDPDGGGFLGPSQSITVTLSTGQTDTDTWIGNDRISNSLLLNLEVTEISAGSYQLCAKLSGNALGAGTRATRASGTSGTFPAAAGDKFTIANSSSTVAVSQGEATRTASIAYPDCPAGTC